MIQCIEELSSQLYRHPLRNWKSFREVEVQIQVFRSADYTDAGVAENAIRHESRLTGCRAERYKRPRIKVSVHGPFFRGKVSVPDAIGPAPPFAADVSHLGLIHRKRQTRLCRQDR